MALKNKIWAISLVGSLILETLSTMRLLPCLKMCLDPPLEEAYPGVERKLGGLDTESYGQARVRGGAVYGTP